MLQELTRTTRLIAQVFSWLSLAILGLPGHASADKHDFKTWRVDIQFVNGSKALSDAAIKTKVDQWVARAERVYQRAPVLDIHASIVKQSNKDGRDLSDLVFDSSAQYASYMDKNFDNVAVTQTEGHMVVLITDRLCIGKQNGKPQCWGGY